MPVIRGKQTVAPLELNRRQTLLEQLKVELTGSGTQGGPLIFEIPLEQSTKMDVLVVWDKFEGLSSDDRTNLILEVYADREVSIALALGVTHREALEQNLLPYGVGPLPDSSRDQSADAQKAMIEEGALVHPSGKVELRFPSLKMAQEVFHRLNQRLPGVRWAIEPSFIGGAIVDW